MGKLSKELRDEIEHLVRAAESDTTAGEWGHSASETQDAWKDVDKLLVEVSKVEAERDRYHALYIAITAHQLM